MQRNFELAPIRQPQPEDIRGLMYSLGEKVHEELKLSTFPQIVRAGYANPMNYGYRVEMFDILSGTLGQRGNLLQIFRQDPKAPEPLEPDAIKVLPLSQDINETAVLSLLQRRRARTEAVFNYGEQGANIAAAANFAFGQEKALDETLEILGQDGPLGIIEDEVGNEFRQRIDRLAEF